MEKIRKIIWKSILLRFKFPCEKRTIVVRDNVSYISKFSHFKVITRLVRHIIAAVTQ